MTFHSLDEKELNKLLETDTTKGLSTAKVAQLRATHGLNELPAEEQESLWEKIKEQFEDVLVRILLGAAVVSFITSYYGNTVIARGRRRQQSAPLDRALRDFDHSGAERLCGYLLGQQRSEGHRGSQEHAECRGPLFAERHLGQGRGR